MGVNIVLLDMPHGLKGCASKNYDGGYTILINAKLSYEQRQKTLLHELHHIISEDFEKSCVDEAEERKQWLDIKKEQMEDTNLIFL